MNFRTTVILIVLLAAAAVWLLFTREHPADQSATPAAATLIDLPAADVTKVIVTPADGTAFTLQKTNATWQLVAPVSAPADSFEVDSLIRAFTEAKPTGSVDVGSGSGLNPPREVVELDSASKTVKLNVGDPAAVGGSLYVQVDGQAKVQLLPAADLSDRLAKGADAYRKTALVSVQADQIQTMTLQRGSEPAEVLQKHGTSWQMIAPVQEPVDDSAASDLTFALSGLRADSFVDPASVAPTPAQLTVQFGTQPATTAPATTQATATTVRFGAFDDILKKNVYVTIAGNAAVAKVPATTLDSFRKSPLDLRDKRVVDFDPNLVKRIAIANGPVGSTTAAATGPTSAPAASLTVVQNVTLEKRHHDATLGPTLPTSNASSRPAATQANQSKWTVVAPAASDADDAKVATLVAALHPLRADKFVAAPLASTRPAAQYDVTITTTGPFGANQQQYVLHLTDPGSSLPLQGEYNGVSFETSRTLLTDLQGGWTKKQ